MSFSKVEEHGTPEHILALDACVPEFGMSKNVGIRSLRYFPLQRRAMDDVSHMAAGAALTS